ncbi:PREDICTED: peptidyl-prolyl cis-trans isomerase CWC27 homolog [Acropora digitifera]|uniref:peptidyl-prolyl cis-trans isomerase CWC27 homolog n=1 Tax=Acropora digitifera TaxID=70779 RepID=UPI00077B1B50|nr:PREDICTED: peptidyl-prolyl cis-trans isomerase CWC27 homolog [Acropora digitifera]
MLKMEDCEVGEDDRPLFPPKIKSTEVLHNPFDDIVPRLRKEDINKEKTEEKRKKIKGTKNFSLLSFGEEAEEEESEVVSMNKTMKMRSSHDMLQDPKLSSQPVVENTAELGNLKEKKKSKEGASDEDSENEISPDEEDFDSRMLDQVRSKLKKRKMGNEEKDDLDEKIVKDPSTKRLLETKARKTVENQTINQSKKESKGESDVLAAFHAEQVTYLEKKKAAQKRKGEGRDEQTLALLSSFQAKLEEFPEQEEDDEEGEEPEDDTGWMFHTLMCENEGKPARDAFIEDEDTFEIYDPRNPINKRCRELSKKSMQNKRR